MPEEKRIMKSTFYRKLAYFLLAFLTVATLSTGSTYAYLKWGSKEPVTNTLKAEETVQPAISETFQNNVKTDVSVRVGETDYTVYVRAAVIVNWVNAKGEIYSSAPVEGVDYELALWEDSSWFESSEDGFYYYKYPVESNGSTSVLLEECKPLKAAPADGYSLQVNIIAQTIQAAGTTDQGDAAAATDAWGMNVQ